MIKRLKKIIVLLSATIILGNIAAVKVFANSRTYTQLNQITDLCYEGYNKGIKGPISITNGVLNKGGRITNVFLICLSGTELVKNQSTGILTDFKSGFEQNSPYLLKLSEVINATLPKGSNLIFAGHSLGGMIAQQASAHANIKNNYNVLHVVTAGSPLINPFGREGEVQRAGDTSDAVPYLSAMGTILLPWQIGGLNKEDGGYKGDTAAAHSKSYRRSDVWGAYDVVGKKFGGATITLDFDQAKFYKAPTK